MAQKIAAVRSVVHHSPRCAAADELRVALCKVLPPTAGGAPGAAGARSAGATDTDTLAQDAAEENQQAREQERQRDEQRSG